MLVACSYNLTMMLMVISSQNLKDFYNLINVYLDAVLHPALTPWTLKQEGWHYEIEDKSQPLTYKGVVFNEMKGVYSSPDAVHGRAAQQV
jgi:presequence protease